MVKQNFLDSRSLWLDYVIIAVLVFMSGTPAVMGEVRAEIFMIVTSLFFLTVFLLRKDPLFTSRFMVVVSVLSVILIIQCITFHFWPFHTMLGFMLRVFIGYAAVRLVREFPKRYVQFMFWLCLISFFFHSFAILRETTGVDLVQRFKPIDRLVNPYQGFNVVVHHFRAYGKLREYQRPNPLRNCSCFWEPSVFSAYLVLAIVFLGLTKDTFDKRRYRRILAVLVIALLTTMSTAGYTLLPLCLLFHVRDLSLTRRQLPKLLGFALVVAIFCVAAYQLDFVGRKIEKHFDSVAYREPGWEITRFGSLIYDLEYIKQRPIFGWGLNYKTRHTLSSGVGIFGMGNGLSDFTVKFGLVGLITVLTSIWIGVYRLTNCKWEISTLFVLFVVMVLNGEWLLNFSVYLGLMFLGPAAQKQAQYIEIRELYNYGI